MKNSTETSKKFVYIKVGVVTCHLYCRRRPGFAKIYIINHNSKYYHFTILKI